MLGFLFGLVNGYIGSLLFHHDAIAISFLMSVGIIFGLKANDSYNTSDTERIKEFGILLIASFVMALTALSVLSIIVAPKSDFCVVITAFLVSGMANCVKVVIKFMFGRVKRRDSQRKPVVLVESV